MLFQKRIDIKIRLPTTDDPPAWKHVIFETTVFKIYLAAQPGASKRFVIILFDQFIDLLMVKGRAHRVERMQTLRVRY